MESAAPVREPSISEIRAELQAVLASRAFRQSRGLAKLLRYICSKAALEGAEPITEYTIAVDVLGKPQDFKDSKDASVRVEAHRLRKRLAEYYEEEGAGHSLRIVIPPGQYAPQFVICDPPPECASPVPESPTEEHAAMAAEAEVTPLPPAQSATVPEPPAPRLARRIGILGAAAAVLALGIAFSVSLWSPADPLDTFWRPVIASSEPILLCFGNVAGAHRSQGKDAGDVTLLQYHGLQSEMMLIPDAVTVARFAGLLQSKGKRYRLASQSDVDFADLQHSPAVLVGLANNDWTERLVGKLRFTLEHRPPGRLVLLDRNNPGREDWAVDYRLPYLSVTRDYALVVRVVDPKTEQIVVTAAGLSAFGTLAAGEFLTTPEEFRKILNIAPKGWQKKNFELVLSTDVIRGKSGHPNIVASHFW